MLADEKSLRRAALEAVLVDGNSVCQLAILLWRAALPVMVVVEGKCLWRGALLALLVEGKCLRCGALALLVVLVDGENFGQEVHDTCTVLVEGQPSRAAVLVDGVSGLQEVVAEGEQAQQLIEVHALL